MKLISWNVNGFRACAEKGFLDFLEKEQPDVIGLQEIKLSAGQWTKEIPGYHTYWNYAEKKGYSGTAVFCRQEPIAVTYGIGIEEHDHEGRVVTVEFSQFYYVCVYTPNAQDELKRLEYRMTWEDAFFSYLKGLEKKKPVIFSGDLNVAHNDIDLKNPKTNHGNPGFSDEERAKFENLVQNGFIDTFRYFYPETEGIYSWWSYRFSARAKNVGWRIDYFMVSEALKPALYDAAILTDVMGSDHCPVELLIEEEAL